MLKLCVILSLTVLRLKTAFGADVITGTLQYFVYNRQLQNLVELSNNDSDFIQNGCDPREQYALIVHGWREGNTTEWVIDTVSNMTAYREGCVMLMTYGNNNRNIDYYKELVPFFDLLARNITEYFQRLETLGFDSSNAIVFGFSFGAQLALEAGRRFGFQKLGRIDACDPAGPSFDGDSARFPLDPKAAAKWIQCIHTSSKFGTSRRNCHVNWNMGQCGKEQPASGRYPKGSHGLCPYFYNSAFTHNFYAVPMPKSCSARRVTSTWPDGFKMGYFCDMESGFEGELFSLTTKEYPYNDESSETL
ncbi:lipase member H-like [Wyeomyia smithii]|uniref:lipase member H-like n=1 Tax=Wyeomyia smithii TaxID=174621 RepID=UPI002467B74D|nr:lipase member H-like [Wyeomyia smithii]